MFSLMWARLHARPYLLQAWLKEVQQEWAADSVTGLGLPLTDSGCEEGVSTSIGYAQPKVCACECRAANQ